MDFRTGDHVCYIPGYKGWHDATVAGFDACRCQYVIELSNGLEIFAYSDDLRSAE